MCIKFYKEILYFSGNNMYHNIGLSEKFGPILKKNWNRRFKFLIY